MEFGSKTYGRIYVEKAEDVPRVHEIIKAIDDFEYDYLPDSFVAVWNGEAELVYGHKFELDRTRLTIACWQEGIRIFTLSNYHDSVLLKGLET